MGADAILSGHICDFYSISFLHTCSYQSSFCELLFYVPVDTVNLCVHIQTKCLMSQPCQVKTYKAQSTVENYILTECCAKVALLIFFFLF